MTEDRMASMLRMLSIEALIAFIAATDEDRVSLLIGGVDGLLELFTWLAYLEKFLSALKGFFMFSSSAYLCNS